MIFFFFLFFASSLFAHDSAYYENRVANNPHDFRALYNLGVASFKSDDLEKAKAAFDCLKPVAMERNWDAQRSEHVNYNAGNVEMKLHKYEDAVESFETVLQHNPDNELARKKLELAKKLLEQEEQKQEDQSEQDNGDEDQRDNKSDTEEQQGDGESKDNREDQSDESSNDQDDKGNNDRSDHDDARDKDQQKQGQEDQSHNQQPDDQEDQGQQHEQNQTNENKSNEQEVEEQDKGPDLTPQEERLLAGLDKLDHDMNKEQAERMFRAIARGHSENNW